MSKNHFHFLIVGGGLNGLILANALQDQFADKKIAILESTDSLGGFCRGQQAQGFDLSYGFKSLPATDESMHALEFLEQTLKCSIEKTIEEITPLTFDSGHFKPFVGFGARAPEFASELDYYLQSPRYKLVTQPHQWVQQLQQKFKGEILFKSLVTKILIADEKATGVIVNGSKTWTADHIVLSAPVKGLATLLPADFLSSRRRQSLTKTPAWSAISLDVIHTKPITESCELHVLMAGTDHPTPCLGYFYKAKDGKQHSQWLSFSTHEAVEETAQVGDILREMKRQIKRAYPLAFNDQPYERILVSHDSHLNVNLKIDATRLPGAHNLWLASTGFSHFKNLIGTLLQSKAVLDEMILSEGQVLAQESPLEATHPQGSEAHP